MKFFLAFALIATVASAAYIKPAITSEAAEIQEIIAAIQSPSTDPATAAALEQMLLDVLGVDATPVVVGPAIIAPVSPVQVVEVAPVSPVQVVDVAPVSPVQVVDNTPVIGQTPVSIGPAIIDFPLPAEDVAVSPVAVAPAPVAEASASAPLVQIILNINQAAAEIVNPSPVVVASPDNIVYPERPVPVIVGEIAADPVQVVDSAPVSPIQVVDVAPVSPVQVVDVAPVTPIQVVDVAPVAVEPVIIGTPVIPSPVVSLPDDLN